jgi:hypothetical protein
VVEDHPFHFNSITKTEILPSSSEKAKTQLKKKKWFGSGSSK